MPEVSCATDTSNFDLDDDPRKREELYVAASVRDFKGYHLPFIGFTYTKNRWVCSPEASRRSGNLKGGMAHDRWARYGRWRFITSRVLTFGAAAMLSRFS